MSEGEWDSGIFCRHWSDADCPRLCARCGHRCGLHGTGEAGCEEPYCGCVGWVEPADES